MKRIVVAALAAFALVFVIVVPASAVTPAPGISGGKFEVTCLYSHSAQVDPIVSPGVPSAHLHDFFGNRGTNAFSTGSSLVGGSTTCKLGLDSAAYWVPAAYRTDTGARVYPVKMFAYYFGTKGPTEALFPVGLEMLSGNAQATSAAQNPNVTWSCGGGGNTKSRTSNAPYNCLTDPSVVNSDGVVAIVRFPVCYDGAGTEPGDVTEVNSNGDCPGQRLTQLHIRIHYGTGSSPSDFQRGDLLTFSSGPYYTFHADFMNGWNQPKLDALVDKCINFPNKDCGFLTDRSPGPV